MIYDYRPSKAEDNQGYTWTDRQGNLLRVANDSWDATLDDDKGHKLNEYLKLEGYAGPGDWNPK